MVRFKSVVLSAILAFLPVLAPAAELGPQKSTSGGVTVTVTPDLSSPKSWAFKVVLDTHTQELTDDLVKTAVLVDASGKRYVPNSWEGAAPGGHHREGVLRFAPVDPVPAVIELQVQRPKEAAPRSFRWKLQ